MRPKTTLALLKALLNLRTLHSLHLILLLLVCCSQQMQPLHVRAHNGCWG